MPAARRPLPKHRAKTTPIRPARLGQTPIDHRWLHLYHRPVFFDRNPQGLEEQPLADAASFVTFFLHLQEFRFMSTTIGIKVDEALRERIRSAAQGQGRKIGRAHV